MQRAFSVQRISERVDHAAEQRIPAGNTDDFSGAARNISLRNLIRIGKQNRTDAILFQVHYKRMGMLAEQDQLSAAYRGKPLYGHNAVRTGNHTPCGYRRSEVFLNAAQRLLKFIG